MLHSEPWSSCTSLIDPEPYIQACAYDMCGCNNATSDFCICSTLSEFSRLCSHAGGEPPNWRTPQFCGNFLCLNIFMYMEMKGKLQLKCMKKSKLLEFLLLIWSWKQDWVIHNMRTTHPLICNIICNKYTSDIFPWQGSFLVFVFSYERSEFNFSVSSGIFISVVCSQDGCMLITKIKFWTAARQSDI